MKQLCCILLWMCWGFNVCAQIAGIDSSRIISAISLYEAVETAQNYANNISEFLRTESVPLPVGINGKNSRYKLIISHISKEDNSVPQIFMSCCVKLDSVKYIAFDGQCGFSGSCGTMPQGKLDLISPVAISFGSTFKLTFNKNTYLEFDCDGVSKIYADITLTFLSDNLIFYDTDGNILNNPPEFNFKISFIDFDDFELQLESKINFAVKGLDGFLFSAENVSVDNSESFTSNTAGFPENFFSNNYDKNLWKGIAVGKAEIILPDFFDNAVHIVSCQNLIIDRNGLSVSAKAVNLNGGELIDSTKWNICANDFSINILRNKIISVCFSGELNIPPFGKNSLVPYSADYNNITQKFDFKCGISGEKEFKALSSKIILKETSYIDVKFSKNGFSPEVYADGKITIAAENRGIKNCLKIPDIDFLGMRISREKPYFQPGVWNFSCADMPEIGGFKFTVKDYEYQNGIMSFLAMVSLNDKISGEGKFSLTPDFEKFKLKEIDVSKIGVEYSSETFSVKGSAEIVKGDLIYGNGFSGGVKLEIAGGISAEAVAFFGNKDRQKYFFVDVFAEKNGGLFTIPPCITVSGLGGGVYKSMSQSFDNASFGKALSGICYKPDFNVGFGFSGSAAFFIGHKKLCSALASLEVQFNKNWGLNYIQLKGDAAFMVLDDKLKALSAVLKDNIEKSKLKEEFLPEEYPNWELKNKSPLTASLLMKYDNTNKIYNVSFNSFLDAGIISGTGKDKKLAFGKAQFGNKDWYLYLGSPDDRCGIKVLNLLNIDGYFMTGNIIPKLPLPPDIVFKSFSYVEKSKFLSRENTQLTSSGKGLAFGLGFQTGSSVEPWPFFAEFNIGAGGEFLLTDYGKNAFCKDKTGNIGFNGWYAQSQIWAYLDAAVGIKVKVFGKKRRFNFLHLSSGAVLKGEGPNPFYFAGIVSGHYSILGGLFKGNCKINFEIGEKCETQKHKELFSESIITQVTPSDSENDVNVFVSPQLVLSVSANTPFEIFNENTGKNETYRVRVEEFTVKTLSGDTLKGKYNFSSDNLIYTFNPDEALDGTTEYQISAKAVFERKSGQNWIVEKDGDENDYREEKTVKFISGKRPDYIQAQDILCSYPINRQYNFYKDEYDDGYICLTEKYGYLFKNIPDGYTQKIGVSYKGGGYLFTDFEYKDNCDVEGAVSEIVFSMKNLNLENSRIYKLQVLNVPIANNEFDSNIKKEYKVSDEDSVRNYYAENTLNQLEMKEICSINFRTSKFNTLREKIEHIGMSGVSIIHGMHVYLKNMNLNLITDDYFDGIERQYAGAENNLVVMEADLENTEWYKNSIYKEVYDKYSRFYSAPKNEMTVFNPDYCNHDRLKDSEIQTNTATGLNPTGNIGYYIVFQCDDDIKELQNEIAKKAAKGLLLSGLETKILNYSLPEKYTQGNYPYNISYRLPGKKIITSTTPQRFIVK